MVAGDTVSKSKTFTTEMNTEGEKLIVSKALQLRFTRNIGNL